MKKIAVIGGGIAGSSIALYLSEIGVDDALHVSLFEKGVSLVNGPPICHLHAGGNLYREISNQQCVTLLKESIDLVRFYPNAVDYRPTVIAVPIDDKGTPSELYGRLTLLQKEYETLIQKDSANNVLGESAEYFKLYEKEEIEALAKQEASSMPKSMDEWMIPVAKSIDLEKVQFPLVMVQEYGLNLFRLGASASLVLEKKANCTLLLNHTVTNIIKSADNTWCVGSKHNREAKQESFDFIINAAGFRSGEIDDMLQFKRERLVEFKAAYVSQWKESSMVWPEVIFYGERGTPKGMAQFTPYPDGYFQLHGMTKDITLFKEGLVKSNHESAYPKLNPTLLNKIDKNWSLNDSKKRTALAIDHVAQYIPAFSSAKVISKPLYGAQQIPGDDATLRAANVSFEDEHYARCEIVKASSVLSMADAIVKQLIHLGFVNKKMYKKRNFTSLANIDNAQVSNYATSLAKERDYPLSLAKRVVNNG